MIGSLIMLIVLFAAFHIIKQTEKTRNPLPGVRSISSELTASDFELWLHLQFGNFFICLTRNCLKPRCNSLPSLEFILKVRLSPLVSGTCL